LFPTFAFHGLCLEFFLLVMFINYGFIPEGKGPQFIFRAKGMTKIIIIFISTLIIFDVFKNMRTTIILKKTKITLVRILKTCLFSFASV
jgi:hypothetical protein